MIFVYLLLKKKKTSIWENDKQEQVCKTQATAIASILGLIFFFFSRRKIHLEVNGLV